MDQAVQRLAREVDDLRGRRDGDRDVGHELRRLEHRLDVEASVNRELRSWLRKVSNLVDVQASHLPEQLAAHSSQLALLSRAVYAIEESVRAGSVSEGPGDTSSGDDKRQQTTIVPTDVGMLCMPARDTVMLPLLRRYGTWEDAEVLRRLLRPGATFVDVGAHVGYYTVLAGRAVGPGGRVIAIEPDPDNFAILEVNVAHAALDNVAMFQVAAWDRPGPLVLERASSNSGDHRITDAGSAGSGAFPTAGITVDELVDDGPCDVVKVDVQGFEHVAIRGMDATIRRCRPWIFVEFSPVDVILAGSRPLEVLRTYRELGYEPRVVGGRAEVARSDHETMLAAFQDPRQWTNLVLRPLDSAQPPQPAAAGAAP